MLAARLIALFALAGCALAGDEAARLSDLPPCFTAQDCSTGFVCLENQCVTNDAIGPDQVHVEVDPPDGTIYARTQFLDQRAIGGVLPLNLSTTAEYEVKVLKDGQPVGARVTFFGENRIPNREDDERLTLNSGVGIVRLLPGTYSARLSLNDRSLPGFEATDFAVRNADVQQSKEFNVPSAYRRLEGTVVSSLAGSLPISGVLVEAVGQQSGLPSTQAVTRADGRYSLMLPDTAETQFLLTARLMNTSSTSWSFEEQVKVEAATREKLIQLELADDARRGCLELKIRGIGSGAPEPIPSANVTLTASTTTGLETRRYSISGITDSAGIVIPLESGDCVNALPFLSEHYLIEVQTAQQSPFASTKVLRELIAVPGETVQEEIALDLRTQATGRVISASGRAVADALLELIPLYERGRTFDAETSFDGTFGASVDPGRYLVVIRPPQISSGELLPVHTVVQTIGSGDLVALDTFKLPVGTEVFGAVRGQQPGGQSVTIPRARVEFFVHQESQTISIARTYSDSTGSYSVVLPNPPN